MGTIAIILSFYPPVPNSGGGYMPLQQISIVLHVENVPIAFICLIQNRSQLIIYLFICIQNRLCL